jgi:hypothetical protein
MAKLPSKKIIPFEFILDELTDLDLHVKPMFGCQAVYDGNRILIILRDRKDYPRDNGVWMAALVDSHASLKQDFPQMRDIELFGPGPTGWQVLPNDFDGFEEACFKLCGFLNAKDPRIGKIPKTKMKKKTAKTEKKNATKPRESKKIERLKKTHKIKKINKTKKK